MHRMSGTWALSLVLLAGCANPVKAWQSSLEVYVADHGNGDLNVLRNRDRDPSASDFGLLGAASGGIPFLAPRRTDADAVLVGLRTLSGGSWYVFLLGTVQYKGTVSNFPIDNANLGDIRIAAVTGGGGGPFRWMVSDPDPAALEAYRRPQVEAWRRRDPGHLDANDAPTVFPTPKDKLRMTGDATAITVVDDHSGAQWTLPLDR